MGDGVTAHEAKGREGVGARLPELATAPATVPRDESWAPSRAATVPDLVPARMINEVLYCERLMYLEWAQGEFEHNEFTVDGVRVHARADRGGGVLPEVGTAEDAGAAPTAPFEARSVWLSSERLGITAKIDVVEGEDGEVTPIEYKRGHAPDVPERAYLPERAQVCAQVLLLRDNGHRCSRGEIYFAGDRRRVPIEIDESLVDITCRAAGRAREVAAANAIPAPLVDSPKCGGCSLVGICLPDEVNLLRESRDTERGCRSFTDPGPAAQAADDREVDAFDDLPDGDACAPHSEADEDAQPELRRLHAARDDRVPVYVQAYGGRMTVTGEILHIATREGETEARLPNTSQVCVFGNVQITTPAIRALLERDIPLSFFTYGGWFLGRTLGNGSKNVELRIAQYRAADDEGFCLAQARRFVAAKILNARTMLRRNHAAPDEVALGELQLLARKATVADSTASLLGLEGTAARLYFHHFTGMLKSSNGASEFVLEGRNRRPPRDPVNAILSFLYALLSKDFAFAVVAAGLDPLLGFYHQPRYGRPALALDLMEEFRPLVADSVAIAAINTGVLDARDFVRAAGSCSLRPEARKNLIHAYERRMDQLVTHPVFGYRLSYRRVLEVQSRLLGRLLLGEIKEYPSFRTR